MLSREEIQDGYSKFLETIKNSISPTSNTVLLVDDEKGIRKKVARDIRNAASDIVIYEASNGKEALDVLANIRKKYYNDPLMIVLDLNMPIMDGWTVIDKLRQEYEKEGKTAGIPIVVLSSTSGEKGAFLNKKSVHGSKKAYVPMITIAKEFCVDKSNYDAVGKQGLMSWIEYFINN